MNRRIPLCLSLLTVVIIGYSVDAVFAQDSSLLNSVTTPEIVAGQQLVNTLSIAQWLGPLAPVALSPFFGITCLSGLSLYGGKFAQHNPLLGAHSPLHNPAVFWTFLTLTILTSVPRFTKVSKPFSQAVDRLEAYSGIVTMA